MNLNNLLHNMQAELNEEQQNNPNDLCLVFKDRAEANVVLFETKLGTNGLLNTRQLYKHIDLVHEDQLGKVLVNIYLSKDENRDMLEQYLVQPTTRTRTWFTDFKLPEQLPEQLEGTTE